MRPADADGVLDRFLAELTAKLAFDSAGWLEYARVAGDATGVLSFPSRLDPRGFASFSCIVSVRIESLSRWLDDEPARQRSTFGTPIHFLREDKRFTEWKFSKVGELDGLRGVILGDLNKFALPFIEQYSRLATLRQAVESTSSKDWINVGLNQDSRVCVLAAIQMTQGDKSGAIKTLDDALAERKTALPKRRIEIERLRKRLIEAG